MGPATLSMHWALISLHIIRSHRQCMIAMHEAKERVAEGCQAPQKASMEDKLAFFEPLSRLDGYAGTKTVRLSPAPSAKASGARCHRSSASAGLCANSQNSENTRIETI